MKKRQHYVPRFYLKSFSRQPKPNRFIIRCFDKYKYKPYEANINDVAVERFFYDYNSPSQIENFLSLLEREFSRVFNQIIQEKSIEKLTGTDYTIMSFFILLQNERTRSARIRNSQIAVLIYKKLQDELDLPDLSSLSEDYKKKLFETRAKKAQLSFMFSPFTEYNINELPTEDTVKKIFNLDWILGINNTKFDFYTSDHPIYIHNPDRNEVPLEGYGQYAYYSKGVKIYFPLTPKLCLILYDGKIYPNAKTLGLKLIINLNELNWINTQVIAQAYRTIFSKQKDFEFVKKCLKNFPELKNPYRNRIFTI